ncbi:glycosyl hydrolase family 18 protein [Thermoanaerobacterium sp. RBIITD]|uniref:glycosyl hydrolase family 18 protein n=1 Tax=Thermoanaerobacterium sp. RBIITD TaxID=1550240 RepID=UPI0021018D2C|nr:glycosyl hydrolase family 18 protein [Thermoanaerobacterium sp. RBIITD]
MPYINGIKKSLNEAPFIANGRTMVPLRFISEALGADVNWDESTYTVNISTDPYKCYILGFYAVRSYPQFKRRAGDFNEASAYWFVVSQDGSIKLLLPNGYEEVRKIADKSGTKLSAMIMGDRAVVSPILKDNVKRANLENNIIETALKYNYDGVNIDFEGLESADKDNFILFLKDLRTMANKNNLKLSVVVPPITTYTTWYQGYDLKAIGSISDSVILMAYDYRNSSTDAGPIAPYWWVDDVINFALNNGIPADKALLGIDFYGYDWAGDTEAQSLTLDEVINKFGGQPYRFDEKIYIQ